ncbi:sensor domain-containing diguanylate cyclase [Sulfurovum mangrovi]|uniref:sensor domain-containing diguanylate cyclase n=1 Tax=Sulfurovum mangrovi TaxID=2893889 RepID=UPI001E3FEB9E|nr:sensor domain-containing diguanylate cyclase [Sulfurovum mangrovi]UFH58598.1 sensor domain-containing diguanylate cyclase [Sulfurovum mangrovi]
MNQRTEQSKVDETDTFNASLTMLQALQQSHQKERKAETLQDAQVRFLYGNLPLSLIISAMLALILIIIQSSVIRYELLFGWFTLISSILLSRTVLYIAWKRSASDGEREDTSQWLFWFRVGVFLTAIAWGIGGTMLTPSGDLGHKVYVSFVLAGLSAGAAASLAFDRISFIGFLSAVLVPQIIFLANEGDRISFSMSMMDALFLMFLLSNAHKFHLQLRENFALRQKAIENELQLHQMLEGSPVAARITDALSDRVVFANKSYSAMIDATPEEVIGLIPSSYYAHPEVYRDIVHKLRNGEHVINKLIELHSPENQNWTTKWVLASYFPVTYKNRPAFLSWLYDITDRKLMEDKVEHMAYHDTLTGLPNRSLIIDHLKQALYSAERENSMLALMFLDLDKFKYVNDRYGHQTGDLLLKAVAKRISGCLRKSDSVARIGGDEFIILLPTVKAENNALEIAEKIRHTLNQPFVIEEENLHISSSIGLAIYPKHATEEQELIKRADIAMYHAKSEGKNCVKTYQQALQEENS